MVDYLEQIATTPLFLLSGFFVGFSKAYNVKNKT
jgi:hypothetical protein